jgi:fermentation-respiration switch protein FrsA (DUF1100 family)
LCLLVVHGERDTTIPPSHGREVFAAAPTPHKHLILAPDLAHNDILSAFPEITSALTACRVVPER